MTETAETYIERTENLIRVLGGVPDNQFKMTNWCDCAIGHAQRDAYFIARRFDPLRRVKIHCSDIVSEAAEFFDLTPEQTHTLFVRNFMDTRQDVASKLQVVLMEKKAKLAAADRIQTVLGWKDIAPQNDLVLEDRH